MSEKTVFKARFTGAEFKQLWEEAKANVARLRGCSRHRFPPLVADWGTKYRCNVCGGEANAEYIVTYCAGFEAAGGNPRAVCANVGEQAE